MCAAWASAVAIASFDIYFYRIGIFKPGTTFDLAGFEGTAEEAESFYKVYTLEITKACYQLRCCEQLYYFADYPFYVTFYLSKAALLAVYLQIFPVFMVKRRRFLWVVIVYVAMGFVITILLLSLSCLPVWRNW